MTTIFKNNISVLLQKDPILATKLLSIKTNRDFEVVQQGSDNLNINIIDKKRNYPIYETKPIEEIMEKKEEFDKKYIRYPYLHLFGIGNGIFVKLLFEAPRKAIFVYEPNIEVLWIALNLVDFSQEILNDKLMIFTTDEVNYAIANRIFNALEVTLYSKTYFLDVHSNYYLKFFSDEIMRINKTFIRAIKQAVNNLGNDTIDTLIGIEHHIQNLPIMLKNPKVMQLKNKKLSDLVIIVSTGPSLTKQLPLLKKIQDYVTIISVDASMPILEKEGIIPDFVTSLERVKETAKFFKETSKEFQEKFITIHASLQHKEVLNNSFGEKILAMRPFRYTRYFKLNGYGFLGRGMSAANMAYELAVLMGYKKIVLIGQDLAYGEDGTSHAKGHVYGEDEVKSSESDEYVIRYGGEGVIKTNKVWNMFRNFFEQYIDEAKKEEIETINATEGGARIEGAVEMPFREVIEKYVTKKKKRKIKLKYPSESEINRNLVKSYKKCIDIINYGEKIQKRVEKVFLKVAKEWEKLVKLNKENRLDKINFKRLQKLSDEIDKIKAIIESKKFSNMFAETIQSYLINKEIDLALISVKNPTNEEEKKAKLIDWIMNHRDWLFNLAGSINAEVIVVKRALKYLEEELEKRNLLEK